MICSRDSRAHPINPVRVTVAGADAKTPDSRLTCERLEFHDKPQTLTAVGAPQRPIVIQSATSGTVEAPGFWLQLDKQTGRLTGPGRLVRQIERAAEAKADTPAIESRIEWTEGVDLDLSAAPEGTAKDGFTALGGLRHAVFRGDIHVVDPQFSLASDQLAATFTRTPQQPQSQLQHIDALGSVRVTMAQGGAIDAAKLRIETRAAEDGRLRPDRLTAEGDVMLRDARQSMKAQHIEAVFIERLVTPSPEKPDAAKPIDLKAPKPEPKPHLEIQTVHAEKSVQLGLNDGTLVSGDVLDANMLAGSATVSGKPATVTRPGEAGAPPAAVLSIDTLNLFNHGKQATAIGPGSFTHRESTAKGATARQTVVKWQQRMRFEDDADTIEVFGSVEAVTEEDALTQSRLSADQMKLELAADPQPKPAEAAKPAPKLAPAKEATPPIQAARDL